MDQTLKHAHMNKCELKNANNRQMCVGKSKCIRQCGATAVDQPTNMYTKHPKTFDKSWDQEELKIAQKWQNSTVVIDYLQIG